MPDDLRRSAAHVFVDDLDHPVLDDNDRHHLLRVLRLAVGEVVSVSDGVGGWRLCRHSGDGTLDTIGERQHDEPGAVEIGVAFAPVKGDRTELVVQKLTEIGVDRIVPIVTARSVVRWDGDRAAKQHERLVRIAREASMQSRRVRLPVVEPLTTFVDVAARDGVCLAEPGAEPVSLDRPLVVIGPEGGFDDRETASLPQVGLPGGILRAETAAITAGVLLVALRQTLTPQRGDVPPST